MPDFLYLRAFWEQNESKVKDFDSLIDFSDSIEAMYQSAEDEKKPVFLGFLMKIIEEKSIYGHYVRNNIDREAVSRGGIRALVEIYDYMLQKLIFSCFLTRLEPHFHCAYCAQALTPNEIDEVLFPEFGMVFDQDCENKYNMSLYVLCSRCSSVQQYLRFGLDDFYNELCRFDSISGQAVDYYPNTHRLEEIQTAFNMLYETSDEIKILGAPFRFSRSSKQSVEALWHQISDSLGYFDSDEDLLYDLLMTYHTCHNPLEGSYQKAYKVLAEAGTLYAVKKTPQGVFGCYFKLCQGKIYYSEPYSYLSFTYKSEYTTKVKTSTIFLEEDYEEFRKIGIEVYSSAEIGYHWGGTIRLSSAIYVDLMGCGTDTVKIESKRPVDTYVLDSAEAIGVFRTHHKSDRDFRDFAEERGFPWLKIVHREEDEGIIVRTCIINKNMIYVHVVNRELKKIYNCTASRVYEFIKRWYGYMNTDCFEFEDRDEYLMGFGQLRFNLISQAEPSIPALVEFMLTFPQWAKEPWKAVQKGYFPHWYDFRKVNELFNIPYRWFREFHKLIEYSKKLFKVNPPSEKDYLEELDNKRRELHELRFRKTHYGYFMVNDCSTDESVAQFSKKHEISNYYVQSVPIEDYFIHIFMEKGCGLHILINNTAVAEEEEYRSILTKYGRGLIDEYIELEGIKADGHFEINFFCFRDYKLALEFLMEYPEKNLFVLDEIAHGKYPIGRLSLSLEQIKLRLYPVYELQETYQVLKTLKEKGLHVKDLEAFEAHLKRRALEEHMELKELEELLD